MEYTCLRSTTVAHETAAHNHAPCSGPRHKGNFGLKNGLSVEIEDPVQTRAGFVAVNNNGVQPNPISFKTALPVPLLSAHSRLAARTRRSTGCGTRRPMPVAPRWLGYRWSDTTADRG